MTKSDFVNRPPPRQAKRADMTHYTGSISSCSNPVIKQIRSLNVRKYREQSKLCFVTGVPLVARAFHHQACVELLITAPGRICNPAAQELIQTHKQRGGACLHVTESVWNSLTYKENTGGIGAVVRQRWERLASVRPGSELCWVVLDSTEYPGNLGTILRTLDAVGGAGVILLGNTADPYAPVCVNASRGAIFSLRIVRTTFEEFACWKQRHGFVIVGTSAQANQDYRGSHYPLPLLLLMGGEQRGLSPELMALCDQIVRIPMVGACDSLNLGVATSIMLYEVYHQKQGFRVLGN